MVCGALGASSSIGLPWRVCSVENFRIPVGYRRPLLCLSSGGRDLCSVHHAPVTVVVEDLVMNLVGSKNPCRITIFIWDLDFIEPSFHCFEHGFD
jgi:hypothetical protein